MITLERHQLKILILVPLAIFSVYIAIGGAQLISHSPATRISVHTLFAFWLSMPAVIGLLILKDRMSLSQILLNSAFLTGVLIHMGSAIKNIYIAQDIEVVRTNADLVTDVLEVTIISILLISSIVARKYRLGMIFKPYRYLLEILLVLIPVSFYGFFSLVVFPTLGQLYFNLVVLVLGITTIMILILAGILFHNAVDDSIHIDCGLLCSAIFLLAISVAFLVLNIPNSNVSWVYTETIQMAASLLFSLSLAVPFLKQTGFRKRTAYGIPIGLIIIAYIPLVITTIFESLSYVPLLPPNELAFSIIHIGASSLSGMMAFLLYEYSKKRRDWIYFPLILIFIIWTLVELTSVLIVSNPFYILIGRPIIPYVIGSILTLVLIVFAIIWTSSTPSTSPFNKKIAPLIVSIFVITISILLGEFIHQVLILQYPSLEFSPYASIILLGSSLIVMFAFSYLVFLLAKQSKGRVTPELYVFSLLSFWIMNSILKSIYEIWSAGWWISEFMLFIGLLIGPTLLASLYVGAIGEIAQSHQKANLYADLLMHDMTNYNQIALTALELLRKETRDDFDLLRFVEDARLAVALSDRLISNVRSLTASEGIIESELEPVELVSSIISALDQVSQSVGHEKVRVQFITDHSHVYVKANNLIITVLSNILYTAITHTEVGDRILLELSPNLSQGAIWWNIRFRIPTIFADSEQESIMIEQGSRGITGSSLGLLVAKIIVESFGGQLLVYEEISSTQEINTIISVHLLGVLNPKDDSTS